MEKWKPDYTHGHYKGQEVYVVTTGPLTINTNHQYQQKPEIPGCQTIRASDPDAVYYIAKEIMNVILKAATKAAGIPAELTTFAGPLVSQLASDVETLVHNSGGDIAGVLKAVGASKTYASCLPVSLVVPHGSKILSIEAWTDRRDKPAGTYKQGEKSFDTLPNGQWESSAESQREKATAKNITFEAAYAAWRIGIDQAVISGIAMNWSNTDDLRARLQVFFDPPTEWKQKNPLRPQAGK